MYDFRSGWYLLYTKPRHEKKVLTRLAETKIKSFCPTKKTLRTWHDRRKYVDEPLFPSYVFIYLDEIRDYYQGMDVDGVLYYVKTGKEVARVQDSVINNIRLIADHSSEVEVTGAKFHAGQKMVIGKGALTGLSCEVVQYNNKEVLLVRVELLQRNVVVSLPTEHLIATPEL
jgi:transcriptional antiterminator RfaH